MRASLGPVSTEQRKRVQLNNSQPSNEPSLLFYPRQEKRQSRHISVHPHTSRRLPSIEHISVVLEPITAHPRREQPRRNAIHHDPLAHQLSRKNTSQVVRGSLGSSVRRRGGASCAETGDDGRDAGAGGDVDHLGRVGVAAGSGLEHGEAGDGEVEHGLDVECHPGNGKWVVSLSEGHGERGAELDEIRAKARPTAAFHATIKSMKDLK